MEGERSTAFPTCEDSEDVKLRGCEDTRCNVADVAPVCFLLLDRNQLGLPFVVGSR